MNAIESIIISRAADGPVLRQAGTDEYEGQPQEDSAAVRLSPDHIMVPVEVRSLGGVGHGLFLTERVEKGTIVGIFGGRATPGPVFRDLPNHRQQRAVQVGDDVYLVSDADPTLGDYINHSCDPSAGLIGEITLAAMRDLEAGEQLTYDYATSDSMPYDEFECECGTDRCRGKVTGEDWLLPEVQTRYDGYFSPYLARRIQNIFGPS